MIVLFSIILFLLALTALIWFIVFLVDYFDDYRRHIIKLGPKIKFNSFRTFYEINPKRWDIWNDQYVECKIPIEGAYYINSTRGEEFHFSYIDTHRYIWWKRQLVKRKSNTDNDKATLRMLEAVKLDIAALEDQSKHEINEAKSILKGIYDVKS